MNRLILSAVASSFAIVAQAQTPTISEMVRPPEAYCTGAAEYIKKKQLLFPTGEPFEVHGDTARKLSRHVFGYVPAVDHAIVFPMLDNGSIMVPCRWGNRWGDDETNRVEIDMTYQRGPTQKTEQPNGVEELPKVKKKTKKQDAWVK